MQFYKKFSQDISVVVGEERALAIPTLLFEKPDTQVILLDDAYQHRKVTPDLNILLTDYNRPFYEDTVLPGGRLRESRAGAKRADVIIVSKCPKNLEEQKRNEITSKVKKYSSALAPVFFTGISYIEPRSVFGNSVETIKKIILFSGIAKAGGLKTEVEKNYELLMFFEYSDHHDYASSDFKKMADYYTANYKEGLALLTTEKDMVKIIAHPQRELLENLPLYYLPIEVFFLKDKDKFDGLILNSLNNLS
jgi:tetraacyldisaccharide 4'-kinase